MIRETLSKQERLSFIRKKSELYSPLSSIHTWFIPALSVQ
jgi:hypothetical protein